MDEALAADIARFGAAAEDPVWRLPLWDPYDKLLEGKLADLNNISGGPFAGSITAALFLRRFVERTKSWAHFDIYAWTPKAKPGRPEGAEVQTARLLYDLLEARYGARLPVRRGKKPPLRTGAARRIVREKAETTVE
jgi:leucyl aminopeptidase